MHLLRKATGGSPSDRKTVFITVSIEDDGQWGTTGDVRPMIQLCYYLKSHVKLCLLIQTQFYNQQSLAYFIKCGNVRSFVSPAFLSNLLGGNEKLTQLPSLKKKFVV